jgi:uncharacterized protein (TIGR04222 family)
VSVVVSLHTEPMQDTWGISGPDFIAGFAVALAAMTVVASLVRLRVTRADAGSAARQPTPVEVAILTGGRSRAVYSALAGLRAAGVVGSGQLGELEATAPAPAGLSRLEFAVYEAAIRRVQGSQVAQDYQVRSALVDLESQLSREGWLLDEEQQRRARLGSWLLLALAAVGAARVMAGLGNHKPVLYIVLLTIATIVIGLLFRRVPHVSATGRRAIASLRRQNAHLSPDQSPAWSTYGMTGAAMGVALFGTSAIWAADPVFAEHAHILRNTTTPGPSASGCGGASCGGGGGGGGGGGCGGGGCGGGGCGG